MPDPKTPAAAPSPADAPAHRDDEARAAACTERAGSGSALAAARAAWLGNEGIAAVVLECTLPAPNGHSVAYHIIS